MAFNRKLLLGTSLILGLVVTCVVFYPGYMTDDSITQLRQAREGYYGDWHPPIMAWIWRILDRIIPGPFGMVLFHNLLFWTGLSFIAYLTTLTHLGAAASVLFVGLFPS